MTSSPRQRLSLGEHGRITVVALRKEPDGRWTRLPSGRHRPDAYMARAKYTDWEGNRGDVRRRANSKARAVAAVEQALREALGDKGATVKAGTPILDACEQWLADARRTDSGKAPRTVAEYTGAFERCIKGVRRDGKGNVTEEVDTPVKALTLGQANDAQRLTRFLRSVAEERGTASVKHVRTVLSGVLQHAVDMGILSTNAMRSVGRVQRQRKPRTTERDTTRAFNEAEREAVRTYVANWLADAEGRHPATLAHRRAVADLVRLLDRTGMRIGEALALRWEHVNLGSGVIHIHGTKSKAADRTVNVHNELRETLIARAAVTGRTGLVFSAPRLADPERPWDAHNCSRAVTGVLAEAGMPWARSHTFRKTVATRLAEGGIPLQRIADWLGHADPSMTASVYLGRSPGGDKADMAAVL